MGTEIAQGIQRMAHRWYGSKMELNKEIKQKLEQLIRKIMKQQFKILKRKITYPDIQIVLGRILYEDIAYAFLKSSDMSDIIQGKLIIIPGIRVTRKNEENKKDHVADIDILILDIDKKKNEILGAAIVSVKAQAKNFKGIKDIAHMRDIQITTQFVQDWNENYFNQYVDIPILPEFPEFPIQDIILAMNNWIYDVECIYGIKNEERDNRLLSDGHSPIVIFGIDKMISNYKNIINNVLKEQK